MLADLQYGVKNDCEHWKQLVDAVLQGGGGNSVQAATFCGFSHLNSLFTFSSLIEREAGMRVPLECEAV